MDKIKFSDLNFNEKGVAELDLSEITHVKIFKCEDGFITRREVKDVRFRDFTYGHPDEADLVADLNYWTRHVRGSSTYMTEPDVEE